MTTYGFGIPPVPAYRPPTTSKLRIKKSRFKKPRPAGMPIEIPELPKPTLWQRITGGTGAALGAVDTGYGYVSEMPWRLGAYLAPPAGSALSKVPFGERLKLVLTTVHPQKEAPGYERPFEAFRNLATEAGAPGAIGAGVGLAGTIATDPFAIMTTPVKVAKAATLLGKGVQAVTKPFMAAPRAMQKYLIKPAEAALAGTKLTKPISGLRIMAAPFVLAGQTMSKIAPKSAEALAGMGHKIARRFQLSKPELAVKHNMGAASASMGRLTDAIDMVERGGMLKSPRFKTALYDVAAMRRAGTKYGGKSDILHKTLIELGDGIKAAADEILAKGGQNFGKAVIDAAEQGHSAGLAQMPRLSPGGERLFRGIVDEFRSQTDDWIRLKQEATGATQVSKFGAEAKQGTFPEIAPELKAAEAQAQLPQELRSIRTSYVPHLENNDVKRHLLEAGAWLPFMQNIRKTLLADPRGLSQQALDDIIRQSWEHFVVRPQGLGELSRIPLLREMSIEEINAAARAAAEQVGKPIPKGAELVVEHVSAYSNKGRSSIGQIAYADAKLATVDAAKVLDTQGQAERIFGGSLKHEDWINNTSYAVDKVGDLRKGKGDAEGWYFLKHGDEWVTLNDDLGYMMENMKAITGQVERADGVFTAIGRWFNAATSVYKGIVLNYSPAYVTTNALDDSIRFAVWEGLPTVFDGYTMDMKLILGGRQSFAFTDGLKVLDMAETDRILMERNLLGYGQTAVEKAQGIPGAFKGAAEYVGKSRVLNPLTYPVRTGLRDLNELLENGRRRAFFLGALQKYSFGRTWEEAVAKAADAVEKALFAYSDITPFEEGLAKYILWYRFFRKNVEYQLRAFALHPWRQVLLLRSPGMLFGESPDFDEKRVLPEWVRMRGPWIVERRPDGTTVFNAGLRLSIFDLNKLWPDQWYREGVGMLAPQLGIPLELATGRYIFLDMPLSEAVRLYTPAIGKALEKLNPHLKGIGWNDIATPIKTTRQDGTPAEYWVVPAWLMYVMAKFRPANDMRRVLDPRNQNKVWFFVTGMRDYPYDMEYLVEKQIGEGLEAEMARQRAAGTLGRKQLDFINRYVEAPAEFKEKALHDLMQARGLERQRNVRVGKKRVAFQKAKAANEPQKTR